MKPERKILYPPLWRKKVDGTLLKIFLKLAPWACKSWGINTDFQQCRSIKNHNSKVTIKFNKKNYEGRVVRTLITKQGSQYRLWQIGRAHV